MRLSASLPAVEPAAGEPPATTRLLPVDVQPLFETLVATLAGTRTLTTDAAEPVAWTELFRLLDRVRESLESSDDLFWLALLPQSPASPAWLALHQARVAVLAMRVAVRGGHPRRRVLEIGLSAALSDVALWEVRPEVLSGAQRPSEREAAHLRTHPASGAQILERLALPLPGVIAVVRQHHERLDGSGFPAALRGAAIDPDALLVGVVTTYAELTARTSPERLRPHETMREILRGRDVHFPAAIVRTLLAEVTPFPPGSRVCLSTGETGDVISVNRLQPLRPRVVVQGGPHDRRGGSRIVDLVESPHIFISRSAEGR
jgi:HD-GYP domain-containing protein (c-di-GMP phosphodiesterase class II)